jgi:pentatricopeptide repeat protein
MKKRAQVPDAQTFTIIFNGCSQHKDSTQALGKVLSMYNSMLTEKSPVRPNTIHLNAVLKMCARAGNMEAMFSIVDQMAWDGLTAPNNLTYTTIFNALRMHITTGPRDTMTPMQRRSYQQKNILHARHVWTDVVKAWRKGKIWIDEELACSMGRLLLVGNEQDHDDVLSLVEQTMNIPRQVPRIGTIERHQSHPGSQSQEFIQVEAPVSEDASKEGVAKEEVT